MLEAFFDGMNWPARYQNAENCRVAYSFLMDDFHYMYNNHTTAVNNEERFFNVTGVVANNFAETFYQCFILLQQIQEGFIDQEATFIDTDDKYTSFLFNLLAQSIVIREYGYEMLDASESQDYVLYARAVGGVI